MPSSDLNPRNLSVRGNQGDRGKVPPVEGKSPVDGQSPGGPLAWDAAVRGAGTTAPGLSELVQIGWRRRCQQPNAPGEIANRVLEYSEGLVGHPTLPLFHPEGGKRNCISIPRSMKREEKRRCLS